MLKQRWKILLNCCICIALLAGLLAVAMIQNEEQDILTDISFSQPSGFYDRAFYLEIRGNGNPIYYTLDSSDPDEQSTLYTGPILIQDRSNNENVYSIITNTGISYNKELMQQIGKIPAGKFNIPVEPVDKATIVRAACIDATGRCTASSTAAYFVGLKEKSGYDGVNIMSITTDPANLFDYKKGIYVLGEKFDQALKDGKVKASDKIFRWPANYNRKGKEWEREAYVYCYDTDRNLVFSGPCGIRVQGRASRALMPKNLNIFTRKEYGCAAFDTQSLFENNYHLNRLNLYNGSDDLMLKDYMISALVADTNVGHRVFCPCVLFLDGEYWGVYWLAPRFKEDYMNQVYGVKKDNIVSIKVGKVEIGQDEDLKFYKDMFSFVADNDMRLPELFERACDMIDMKSCVDYYAEEIYIANEDWPQNNYALWRTRHKASNPYSDTRWRWLLFDLDHAAYRKNAEADMLNQAIKRNTLFASLMQNEDFARMITDRLLQLADDTFAPERVDAFIDAYESDMADIIEKKYKRFLVDYDMDKLFYAGCEEVREFFHLRQAYIKKTYGGENNGLQ